MVALLTVSAVAFPARQVEASLRAALIDAVTATAATQGLSVPSDPYNACAHPFEIDSLVVVELLCTLDSVLDFEVGESVVRAGGYDSIDETIQDLLPKLANEWKKHRGTTA